MDLASAFEILPAIDLRGGRVVRLEQGDFTRETAFADDPVATAVAFADAGARWLHVVDLDGARSGAPAHGTVIRSIVGAVGARLSVEVAGGLRSPEAVATVLEAGAARAVIGTMALRDPSQVGHLVATHGTARIAVALDVRDGMAVGEAWRVGADGLAVEVALANLRSEGATTFEVTAIDRDGGLGGPDLALYRRLTIDPEVAIIASAGVATTADIAAIRDLGCTGAIIGRALYDGSLRLADALAVARGP
jgi:phosphoribosylformimino-5-aminoimidazole carboxamide ribotide isomerase